MYVFLDKLFNIVLPRIRDFRGLPRKSFDGRGNYNMGLKEQIVFPEINFDKVDKARGMDIVDRDDRQERRRSDGVSHADGPPAAKGPRRQSIGGLQRGGVTKMAKTSSIEKSKRTPKFARAPAQPLPACADARAATIASSACAASVSAKTRTAAFIPGITKASW